MGQGQAVKEFDMAVKESVEEVMGTPLPPHQWDQACLPISLGGLGLRSAASHGAAAYIASVGDSELLVQAIRGRHQGVDGERAVSNSQRRMGG